MTGNSRRDPPMRGRYPVGGIFYPSVHAVAQVARELYGYTGSDETIRQRLMRGAGTWSAVAAPVETASSRAIGAAAGRASQRRKRAASRDAVAEKEKQTYGYAIARAMMCEGIASYADDAFRASGLDMAGASVELRDSISAHGGLGGLGVPSVQDCFSALGHLIAWGVCKP